MLCIAHLGHICRKRYGFISMFGLELHWGHFSFHSRFDGVNQRGHTVGSWLEDGSWGLGVFAPDTSKFRVYTYTLAPVYCAAHVLLSALCIYTNHAHAACCTANVRIWCTRCRSPKGSWALTVQCHSWSLPRATGCKWTRTTGQCCKCCTTSIELEVTTSLNLQ